MDLIIEYNKENIKKFGSLSLMGEFGKFVVKNKFTPEKVIIVFLQTSLEWRRNNGGADLWTLPEYVIPSIINDILIIKNMGITVEIISKET